MSVTPLSPWGAPAEPTPALATIVTTLRNQPIPAATPSWI